jgi:hypothetical protein
MSNISTLLFHPTTDSIIELSEAIPATTGSIIGWGLRHGTAHRAIVYRTLTVLLVGCFWIACISVIFSPKLWVLKLGLIVEGAF